MKPVWEGRRVVVCVGTGGVGKTTTAAAVALAAAASGLRTLVMTIDPARRLANALGLASIGNVEREISDDMLAPFGARLTAPLWVMMPDVKRTFDDLIERFAPNDERRDAIFRNRLYQQFSTVLAGSLEYAAVEKLYEVHESRRYDLIVLDTPPSQNAIDFLEAPGRILDFLDQESLQWLLKPYALAGKFSLKLLDLGSSFLLRHLSRMAGGETIRELADFVHGFGGMYDGFRERSGRVRSLLASDELAFLLVTSTQRHQLPAVIRFREELYKDGLQIRTLVVNRVRHDPLQGLDRAALEQQMAALLAPLPAESRAAAEQALADEVSLAERSAAAVARLRQEFPSSETTVLPELPLDVHDLASLALLHRHFLPAQGGENGPPATDPCP